MTGPEGVRGAGPLRCGRSLVRRALAPRRCAKKLFLNHYVTKSREEFLGKYRKGKLSQATKEQEMDVDRDEFVRLMGDAFVEVSCAV